MERVVLISGAGANAMRVVEAIAEAYIVDQIISDTERAIEQVVEARRVFVDDPDRILSVGHQMTQEEFNRLEAAGTLGQQNLFESSNEDLVHNTRVLTPEAPVARPDESAMDFQFRMLEFEQSVDRAADMQMQADAEMQRRAEDQFNANNLSSMFDSKTQGDLERAVDNEAALENLSPEDRAALEAGRFPMPGDNDFVGPVQVRETRSSDGTRVSMEPHEYRYCMTPIQSLQTPGQSGSGSQQSYIATALMLIRGAFIRGNTIAGNTGEEINSLSLASNSNITPAMLNTVQFDSTNYSYGNFVDSPNMRRFLAVIRRIVRLARSKNVLAILRSTSGETTGEFIRRLLNLIDVRLIARAAAEYVLIDMDGNEGQFTLSDFLESLIGHDFNGDNTETFV